MNKEEIQYVYSGRFDSAFLDEMYAGDIQTAAEIFESSLNHLLPASGEATMLYRNRDVEALRKFFHKIKPLYGYVGLLKVQAKVQLFEEACAIAGNTEELKTGFNELLLLLEESLNIIRQELIRMKMYLNVRA
jgi:hypothetical protein